MGVQPIDPAALIRGPVVAYGHQAFLLQIAVSGIRYDFSGICACELHTVESFHHNLRVRPYVVDHWHNAYKI